MKHEVAKFYMKHIFILVAWSSDGTKLVTALSDKSAAVGLIIIPYTLFVTLVVSIVVNLYSNGALFPACWQPNNCDTSMQHDLDALDINGAYSPFMETRTLTVWVLACVVVLTSRLNAMVGTIPQAALVNALDSSAAMPEDSAYHAISVNKSFYYFAI
jgi:hypothetical protein